MESALCRYNACRAARFTESTATTPNRRTETGYPAVNTGPVEGLAEPCVISNQKRTRTPSRVPLALPVPEQDVASIVIRHWQSGWHTMIFKALSGKSGTLILTESPTVAVDSES